VSDATSVPNWTLASLPVAAAQRHHPGGLPERQLEQDLNRQAELDRRITEHRSRPGLPSGGANQVIPLSSQISSDPRLRSAAV
jgi:hypothetical protein